MDIHIHIDMDKDVDKITIRRDTCICPLCKAKHVKKKAKNG